MTKKKAPKRIPKRRKNKIVPQWRKLGFTKDGEPIPPRLKPKDRLAPTEPKTLDLFVRHNIDSEDKGQTTEQMLIFYKELWPNDRFNEQKMARDLKELRQNWFLESTKGIALNISRSQEQYTTTRKTKNWLSQKFNAGDIAVDANRWVIVDSVYLADEKTRLRREALDRKRAQAKKAKT